MKRNTPPKLAMVMITIVVISVLATILVACEGQDRVTRTDTISNGWPPTKYAGDITVPVLFASNVSEACIAAGLKDYGPAYEIQGCTLSTADGKPIKIIVSNPCRASPQGSYGRIVCHEIGHANGWPADHPNK